MKKHYENYRMINFVFCILLVMIFIFIVIVYNSKISIYKIFSGVVLNDNIILLVLRDDEVKLFQKNKVVFIDNEKIKFNVEKIDEEVDKGKKYYQIYIETSISNLYKIGDILNISIKEKRIRSYEIFKIVWKGGYNEED